MSAKTKPEEDNTVTVIIRINGTVREFIFKKSEDADMDFLVRAADTLRIISETGLYA